MSSSKGNLKDLSIQEIDDLIKEKATSLKHTEEKMTRNHHNTTSTNRRREQMRSKQPKKLNRLGLVLNFSPKNGHMDSGVSSFKNEGFKNPNRSDSHLIPNTATFSRKFHTAKNQQNAYGYEHVNTDNTLLANGKVDFNMEGSLLDQLCGVVNKENDAIKPNSHVPRVARRSRRTENSSSVRRRGQSSEYGSNKTDKKAVGQALQALQKRNKEVEKQMEFLKKENDRLKQVVEEKDKDLEILDERMNQEVRRIREDVTQSKINEKIAEDGKHELSQKIKELTCELELKDKEISRLRERSTKEVKNKEEVIVEEEKKVTELNEILEQNSKFIQGRDQEVNALRMEVDDYQKSLQASYEKYKTMEFELSNKVYSLESDLTRTKNQYLELQGRCSNIVRTAKRDKDILEKRLKNEKNKFADSKHGYESRISDLREDLADLEKESNYLRKTNENLEKMLSKEKSGKRVETKGQRDLINIVELSIELIDDIMRNCKGQKNLIHIFKNFQQRRRQVEKKFKNYRTAQAKYLQSGKTMINARKKSIMKKGIIATKKVTEFNYPQNKRRTPKRKRKMSRGSSIKKKRRSRRNSLNRSVNSRRSSRNSVTSKQSKRSRRSRKSSKKRKSSRKRKPVNLDHDFEDLSERKAQFVSITDISQSDFSDLTDKKHNQTVNYFDAQPLYLSSANNPIIEKFHGESGNHIHLMDYQRAKNDSLAYESNHDFDSRDLSRVNVSASSMSQAQIQTLNQSTYENLRMMNMDLKSNPNSLKKKSEVSYNFSDKMSVQGSTDPHKMTLNRNTQSLIKANLLNPSLKKDTNRTMETSVTFNKEPNSNLTSEADRSKDNLKKEIRSMEDSIIKLKKVYKQKLNIDTSGMSADDISQLRQDLGKIMTDIEEKGDYLLKKRKLMRSIMSSR